MKTPEWPGIATAVGIILIVMIGADLSKWQPLAAALIALGGGLLAYRGAMLKLRQDEAERRREFLRRQLALYLKLELALRMFQPEAQENEAAISFRAADGEHVLAGDLRLKEPPEISEAWDNLDVFPRRLIREIASIRSCIREIDDLLMGVPNDKKLYSSDKGGSMLDVIHERISTIVEACAIILAGLEPEIEQLAPIIPDNERMLTIYGEPYADD